MKNNKLTFSTTVLAVLLAGPAARAAETNVLQTVRPLVAQVTSEFGQIPVERQRELKKIALFVKSKIAANEPAQLTFICTHNSRRSHLAQVWAQTAAAYYDVVGVRTFSGGTEATACNIRTVRAMRRAGFSVALGKAGANPEYLIQYSETAEPLHAFSKVYSQGGNPTDNYIAVMTCSQADKNCPVVEGSSMRVAIPYADPKEADGKPEEEATYDERCKQIARDMFYLMSQAKP
ncbi:MAG: protein-tyrosine-phosphatase [Verrucomicrobiota bacterium]